MVSEPGERLLSCLGVVALQRVGGADVSKNSLTPLSDIMLASSSLPLARLPVSAHHLSQAMAAKSEVEDEPPPLHPAEKEEDDHGQTTHPSLEGEGRWTLSLTSQEETGSVHGEEGSHEKTQKPSKAMAPA